MKFKKRFLMCLAIVGVLLVPSMAKAGDAIPAYGWMRSAPNDDLVNVATAGLRTDNNLRRNQTLYWAIRNGVTGTTPHTAGVIDTSASPPVVDTCGLDGTGSDPNCASAPLFISAQTAILCADGDLATAGAVHNTVANMRVCSDSTCADFVSIDGTAIVPGDGGSCVEFAGTPEYNGFNVGAMWVFIEVTTVPSATGTTLFWIVGN
jgi:hypothetical protein